MTKKLAESQAISNQEVLRTYSLKAKEDEYLKRMITQLNAEFSPFKDEEKRDSLFLREMLDNYRKAEDFKKSTTTKQIMLSQNRL